MPLVVPIPPMSPFQQSLLSDADAGARLTALGMSAFQQSILADVDGAARRASIGAVSAADIPLQLIQTYALASGSQLDISLTGSYLLYMLEVFVELLAAGSNQMQIRFGFDGVFKIGADYTQGYQYTTNAPAHANLGGTAGWINAPYGALSLTLNQKAHGKIWIHSPGDAVFFTSVRFEGYTAFPATMAIGAARELIASNVNEIRILRGTGTQMVKIDASLYGLAN